MAFSKINSLDFIVCPFFCELPTGFHSMSIFLWITQSADFFYFPFQLFNFFFIRTSRIKEKWSSNLTVLPYNLKDNLNCFIQLYIWYLDQIFWWIKAIFFGLLSSPWLRKSQVGFIFVCREGRVPQDVRKGGGSLPVLQLVTNKDTAGLHC